VVVHETLLLSDQVTAVLVELVTVAVNDAVCGGQLSAESFGYRVEPEGLTLTLTAGVLLLPQATRSPTITSARHRPPARANFDRLRPANPAITTPANGRVMGSHGRRLSARRCSCFLIPPCGLGPVVVMVSVSLTGLAVPAGIGFREKVQVTVGSGRPRQERLTAPAKVVTPVPVAVTVNVDVVD